MYWFVVLDNRKTSDTSICFTRFEEKMEREFAKDIGNVLSLSRWDKKKRREHFFIYPHSQYFCIKNTKFMIKCVIPDNELPNNLFSYFNFIQENRLSPSFYLLSKTDSHIYIIVSRILNVCYIGVVVLDGMSCAWVVV